MAIFRPASLFFLIGLDDTTIGRILPETRAAIEKHVFVRDERVAVKAHGGDVVRFRPSLPCSGTQYRTEYA